MKTRNGSTKNIGRFVMRNQYNSSSIKDLCVYSRLEWILFQRSKIIKAIKVCDDPEAFAFWQGKIHECIDIHSDLLLEARKVFKDFATTVSDAITGGSDDED